MKLRTAVARCLTEAGIDTVFGVMGGGNMYMVYDMVHSYGAKYVSAAREDGAILMADGYARRSGRLALATVTYGPGLTNSVTALTEAARARTPMLVLTGHAPAASLPLVWQDVQTIDHEQLVAPTGASYRRVRSVGSAVADVADAIRAAVLGRRPVVIGVPTDLQEVLGDFRFPRSYVPELQRLHPDPEALDRAAGVIASAHRCLVLAGRGAVSSGAKDDLIKLAHTLRAPLATSLLAKDYFLGEPNNVGVVGTLASELAGEAVSRADCIIAVGASLNPLTASGGSVLEGKRVVHCVDDVLSIGRYFRIDVPVVGDATVSVRAINRMLVEVRGATSERPEPRERGMQPSQDAGLDPADQSNDETVDVRTAMIRLDELLPARRTVVTDGGRFTVAPLIYLTVPEPQALVVPLSFAAVGSGLGAAIGASFAAPDWKTVLVVGDGGLMMSLVEFNTAVQNQLDLLVVVLNDGAFGQEIARFERAGMDPSLAYLEWPDLAPLANSLGGRGVTVRCLDDFEAVRAALTEQGGGPLLVDVKVDPLAKTGPGY